MIASICVVLAGNVFRAGPAAASSATIFPSSVPSWANSANDAGVPTDDPTVEGEIFLSLKDLLGAQKEALAVSTPGSPAFHKYLTPTAWISHYAPSLADFKDVRDYVVSEGFSITGSPASREYIVFRGPASKVQSAFDTKLRLYRFAGRLLLAPSTAPALPATLGAKVLGMSLDQGSSLTRPDYVKSDGLGQTATTPQASASKKPAPLPTAECSSYWDQNEVTEPVAYGRTSFPTNICGYTASQIGGAYGVTKLQTSGITGTGQTIAIVDAYSSPTILKDSQTVEARTGSPLLRASQFDDITPAPATWTDQDACADPSGWQPEESIDVQAAHGMAPSATILYSGGTDCGGGLDLALSKIIDSRLATIVSNSYGDVGEALPSGVLVGEESRELQAAAEGIGLYFSSGDDGDETDELGYATPDFEASSPFVTAVGGTSLAVSAANTYEFETAWGNTRDQVFQPAHGSPIYIDPLPGSTFRGGSGGGVSTNFAEPDYQKGVVPTQLATETDGSTGRVVPDISSVADPNTGFLIGLSPITDDTTLSTNSFSTATYGGTSLAAPLIAGQAALAQQIAGVSLGFINPALYALDKTNPNAFHDVKPFTPPKALGSSNALGELFLTTLDRDSSLTTRTGYDDATGIGTPNVASLADLASAR